MPPATRFFGRVLLPDAQSATVSLHDRQTAAPLRLALAAAALSPESLHGHQNERTTVQVRTGGHGGTAVGPWLTLCTLHSGSGPQWSLHGLVFDGRSSRETEGGFGDGGSVAFRAVGPGTVHLTGRLEAAAAAAAATHHHLPSPAASDSVSASDSCAPGAVTPAAASQRGAEGGKPAAASKKRPRGAEPAAAAEPLTAKAAPQAASPKAAPQAAKAVRPSAQGGGARGSAKSVEESEEEGGGAAAEATAVEEGGGGGDDDAAEADKRRSKKADKRRRKAAAKAEAIKGAGGADYDDPSGGNGNGFAPTLKSDALVGMGVPVKKGSQGAKPRHLGGGLSVVDTVVGLGPAPTLGRTVKVLYEGFLAKDGTLFDSKQNKRAPLCFRLGLREVVPGFDKGLQGMRVGGSREVRIPAAMGYGAKRTGPIPPNSDLVFKIDLIGTK